MWIRAARSPNSRKSMVRGPSSYSARSVLMRSRMRAARTPNSGRSTAWPPAFNSVGVSNTTVDAIHGIAGGIQAQLQRSIRAANVYQLGLRDPVRETRESRYRAKGGAGRTSGNRNGMFRRARRCVHPDGWRGRRRDEAGPLVRWDRFGGGLKHRRVLRVCAGSTRTPRAGGCRRLPAETKRPRAPGR